MARAVFPHEITDPDFQWLLNTYCESHPNSIRIENSCLPVVVVIGDTTMPAVVNPVAGEEVLALPPGDVGESDSSSHKK